MAASASDDPAPPDGPQVDPRGRVMTTFHVIEEERGTCTGTRHAHNGYYAGDFGTGASASFPATMVVLRTAAHPSERRCA